MTAGDLKQSIQLERDAITRVNGAEVRTPTVYATVWAKVEYLSGSEAWRAKQVNADVNVRATIRYRTDVLPSDRVIYRGKHLEIKAVIPDEQGRDAVTLELKG